MYVIYIGNSVASCEMSFRDAEDLRAEYAEAGALDIRIVQVGDDRECDFDDEIADDAAEWGMG